MTAASSRHDGRDTLLSGRAGIPIFRQCIRDGPHDHADTPHRIVRRRGLARRIGTALPFRAGAGQFGSGWVFVTVSRQGKLAILSKPNQDTPLMDGGRILMGNDVWEHAYYLKYQNRRPDYLAAWWNVLDWSKINARYEAAK